MRLGGSPFGRTKIRGTLSQRAQLIRSPLRSAMVLGRARHARIVAILVSISPEENKSETERWYLQVGFGPCEAGGLLFASLSAAEIWVRERVLEHATLSLNSSDPAEPTDLQELSSCEAEPGSSRSFRLLIVEDDGVLALELQSCLQSLGHVVVGMAATAPAAVEAAETHRPDLVLMDVRLANGTNGVDAASVIQKRLGILSIFMTAHADVQTRARVAQIRSLELLSNPVTPNAIAAALNRAAKGVIQRSHSLLAHALGLAVEGTSRLPFCLRRVGGPFRTALTRSAAADAPACGLR